MSDKFQFNDIDEALESYPKIGLKEDAKDRIQQALMEEAKKYDDRKRMLDKVKKSSIWMSSVAAAVILSFLAISNIGNGTFERNDEAKYALDAPSPTAESGDRSNSDDLVEKSEEPATDSAQEEWYQEDNASEKSADEGAVDHGDTSKDVVEQKAVSPEYIRSQLTLHMNQAEVARIFGNDYTEVVGAKNGTDMWRYDFGLSEGYTPISTSTPDGKVMDDTDIEGVKNGKITIQLFVEWDETGSVLSYSFYYLKEDGNVYNYRVFSDGTIREQEIG